MLWYAVYLVLLPLAFLVVALVVWLASKPSRFRVSRTLKIDADQDRIYDAVLDLRNWIKWSPWLMHEPTADQEFSESEKSVDSWSRWDGQKIGAGQMTHLGIQRPDHLDQQVEFFRPFKSKSGVEWSFSEDGNQTSVTWAMIGKMPFFMRWMTEKMDQYVGTDYEIGLKQLAMYLGDHSDPIGFSFHGEAQQSECRYVSSRFSGTISDMQQSMSGEFQKLFAALETAHVQPSGVAFTMYHVFKPERNFVDCEMCVPVASETQNVGNLESAMHTSYSAMRTEFRGNYENLKMGWHAAFSHLRFSGRKFAFRKPCVERYLSDPRENNGLDLVTQIDIPLR